MKTVLKIISIMAASYLLAAQTVRAQSDIELSCRAKAKEVAVEAYTGCVSEGRKARLSEIRTSYKAEVASVKAKYDQMLKDMGTPNASAKAAPAKKAKAAAPTRMGRAEKPTTGVAKSLPAKQNDNGPALPLTGESDEQAVVTVDASEGQDPATTPDPEMVEVY
jgi:hypothetical protein